MSGRINVTLKGKEEMGCVMVWKLSLDCIEGKAHRLHCRETTQLIYFSWLICYSSTPFSSWFAFLWVILNPTTYKIIQDWTETDTNASRIWWWCVCVRVQETDEIISQLFDDENVIWRWPYSSLYAQLFLQSIISSFTHKSILVYSL